MKRRGVEFEQWFWFKLCLRRDEWQTKQKKKEPAVEHCKAYHFSFPFLFFIFYFLFEITKTIYSTKQIIIIITNIF